MPFLSLVGGEIAGHAGGPDSERMRIAVIDGPSGRRPGEDLEPSASRRSHRRAGGPGDLSSAPTPGAGSSKAHGTSVAAGATPCGSPPGPRRRTATVKSRRCCAHWPSWLRSREFRHDAASRIRALPSPRGDDHFRPGEVRVETSRHGVGSERRRGGAVQNLTSARSPPYHPRAVG